jgi:hypothetical protein
LGSGVIRHLGGVTADYAIANPPCGLHADMMPYDAVVAAALAAFTLRIRFYIAEAATCRAVLKQLHTPKAAPNHIEKEKPRPDCQVRAGPHQYAARPG